MSASFRLSFYKLYLLLSIFGALVHLYTIINMQNEDIDPRIQSVFSKNWNQLQKLYNRSKHPSLKGIKYEEKMQLCKTFYNGLKSESNWQRSLTEKFDEHNGYFTFDNELQQQKQKLKPITNFFMSKPKLILSQRKPNNIVQHKQNKQIQRLEQLKRDYIAKENYLAAEQCKNEIASIRNPRNKILTPEVHKPKSKTKSRVYNKPAQNKMTARIEQLEKDITKNKQILKMFSQDKFAEEYNKYKKIIHDLKVEKEQIEYKMKRRKQQNKAAAKLRAKKKKQGTKVKKLEGAKIVHFDTDYKHYDKPGRPLLENTIRGAGLIETMNECAERISCTDPRRRTNDQNIL